jgi:hypothetical protein
MNAAGSVVVDVSYLEIVSDHTRRSGEIALVEMRSDLSYPTGDMGTPRTKTIKPPFLLTRLPLSHSSPR